MRHIGCGIDENVAMVEGRDEPDVRRQQHAVAENIARHVADARDRKRLRLDIAVDLTKMPLHGLPRATRGNAHFFVIVANRPA